MRLSEKYPVPEELALLYEFVNSLDLRRFVEQGAPHATGDELATAPQLEGWMRARGLLDRDARLGTVDYRKALGLREALRSFLQVAPEARARDAVAATRLSEACTDFPLVLKVSDVDAVTLQPAPGTSGLARVLAELHLLAETDRLDRLKMCASDDCRWIFYDRSKPGNRRWCSSALCGNRQKTRTYRQRRRQRTASTELP